MKKVIIILIILVLVGVWYFYIRYSNAHIDTNSISEYREGSQICNYLGKKVMKVDSRSIDGSLALYDMNGNLIGENPSFPIMTKGNRIHESLIIGCAYPEF